MNNDPNELEIRKYEIIRKVALSLIEIAIMLDMPGDELIDMIRPMLNEPLDDY